MYRTTRAMRIAVVVVASSKPFWLMKTLMKAHVLIGCQWLAIACAIGDISFSMFGTSWGVSG